MILRDKEKRNALRKNFFDKLEMEGDSIRSSVKTLRKILMKDQTEFALLVGISLPTLRKIEQGKSNIELESLLAILNKFSLELVVKSKGNNK